MSTPKENDSSPEKEKNNIPNHENASRVKKTIDDVYPAEIFHEDPEQVKRDVSILRKMISEDDTLYAPTDDGFLLRFLRSMHFDHEGTFQLIHKYYNFKVDYPKMHEKTKPSEVLNAFENNMFMLLPDRDDHGRCIFVFKAGAWDPDNCPVLDSLRGGKFSVEVMSRDEETQKNGVVVITDWKGFVFRHARHYRPWNLKIITTMLQECLPIRFIAFHVVNQDFFFEMVFMIGKRFICEDFQRRIHFHGNNWESLHHFINPEILPQEYGGTQPDCDNSSFVRKCVSFDDEFVENAKYGYKEKF